MFRVFRSFNIPTCQGKLARKWLAARMGELLAIPYFHLVFTLPDTFVPLALGNPEKVYGLLLRTAGDVLLAAAAKTFGGAAPVIGVLHTWGQRLWPHPHGHFIVGSGALRFDGKAWVPGSAEYLFDVRQLSAHFRDLFCRRLSRARLKFAGDTAALAERAVFEAFLERERSRAGPLPRASGLRRASRRLSGRGRRRRGPRPLSGLRARPDAPDRGPRIRAGAAGGRPLRGGERGPCRLKSNPADPIQAYRQQARARERCPTGRLRPPNT